MHRVRNKPYRRHGALLMIAGLCVLTWGVSSCGIWSGSGLFHDAAHKTPLPGNLTHSLPETLLTEKQLPGSNAHTYTSTQIDSEYAARTPTSVNPPQCREIKNPLASKANKAEVTSEDGQRLWTVSLVAARSDILTVQESWKQCAHIQQRFGADSTTIDCAISTQNSDNRTILVRDCTTLNSMTGLRFSRELYATARAVTAGVEVSDTMPLTENVHTTLNTLMILQINRINYTP